MVGLMGTASAVFDLVSKHYTASSTSFAKIARHIMVRSPACARFRQVGWIELSILRCDAECREFWLPGKLPQHFIELIDCAAAGRTSDVFRQRKIRLWATHYRWKFEKRLSL